MATIMRPLDESGDRSKTMTSCKQGQPFIAIPSQLTADYILLPIQGVYPKDVDAGVVRQCSSTEDAMRLGQIDEDVLCHGSAREMPSS